jgi:3-isopropylmalate dehydrogenase
VAKKRVKILILAGDGIGPEVMRSCQSILETAAARRFCLDISEGLIGGASLDKHGTPVTDGVLKEARSSRAVLLGAVGGPKWDKLPYEQRPEQGLLKLRRTLKAYANLRPVRVWPCLAFASTLKPEVIADADFIVVRELTGGIYFGRPRGLKATNRGEKGYNTEVYHRSEIERIARFAFDLARSRRSKVTSVDKANILESSALWRRVVEDVKNDYPDVELNHLYVDNCAMQIIRNPRQFDVILTNNLFGDILSDEAAMVSGSIGMLASASLGGRTGLYEPIHGSAPDICGQDRANPCATILSLALMFRYTLGEPQIGQKIEEAVAGVLECGFRTPDIAGPGSRIVGTAALAEMIRAALDRSVKR